MAAPIQVSDSSSPSSEDEEENAKLKEAIYETEIFSKVKAKPDFVHERVIPSKRPDKEIPETDCFDNTYNTTPGFRKHVSRKLSESLDSEIDSTKPCFCDIRNNTVHEDGVKLLSSSKNCLQVESTKPTNKNQVRKRPLPSSSDSSSEDERLAEASVSHDFVFQQSNLPSWTNQKPADIVINQADLCPSATTDKDNENKHSDCDIRNNGKGKKTKIDQINRMDEKNDRQIKKHKKKKKKKHKKEEEVD